MVTDPEAHAVTYDWQRRNRVTKVTDGTGVERDAAFDANDDQTTATLATTEVTTQVFDQNTNNLEQIQAPVNGGNGQATTSFDYNDNNAPNQETSRVDPQGNCQRFDHDTNGNLESIHDGATNNPCHSTTASAGGDLVQIARNGDGTVSSVTNPRGHATTYDYDTDGNLESIDYPNNSLGIVYIDPDALSRVDTFTDAKSQVTKYIYDLDDRITQIRYNGAANCWSTTTCTSFDYDEDGLLTSRTDVTGTTTFSYDGLGRLTGKKLP